MNEEKRYLDAESFVEYWKEKGWLYEHYPVPAEEVVADAIREKGVLFTNEQFKLLERCLKMYYNACELIDETNNDFVDTSSERNDVVRLSNVLEEIFGKTIDLR